MKLIELENFAAHDIAKVIVDFYQANKLPIGRLVMVTSDGAAVMVGRSKGVVSALQVSAYGPLRIVLSKVGYFVGII